jgi:hypothetical protein
MHYSAGKFQINQFLLTVCKERSKSQLEAQMAINYEDIISDEKYVVRKTKSGRYAGKRA